MRNQKGLTLIEVMGSITILGIAVLAITFILQQSTIHTKSNEKSDEAVVAARNVMEEIKSNLRSSTAQISLYGQAISLYNLRNLSSATIYYPDDSNRQYEVQIHSYATSLGTVSLTVSNSKDLDTIFRRITVTSTELSTSREFELEAIVEYN
jgi:prepilin-type N-terminal cleavage/methylation domain-containing protein